MVTKLRVLCLDQYPTPQYMIGAAAGIHHSVMSMYCLGTKDISPKHAARLAEVFDCEIEDVIGDA